MNYPKPTVPFVVVPLSKWKHTSERPTEAYVSPEDSERVLRYKWHANQSVPGQYYVRGCEGRAISKIMTHTMSNLLHFPPPELSDADKAYRAYLDAYGIPYDQQSGVVFHEDRMESKHHPTGLTQPTKEGKNK